MYKDITIKGEYVELLDGDHCAALLCSVYERFHLSMIDVEQNRYRLSAYQKKQYEYEEEALYQFHSKEDLHFEVGYLFGVTKVGQARIKLVELGILIEKENKSKHGRYDNTKCYLFNHIKLAEMLGRSEIRTNEELISNGVLVKNGQRGVLVKSGQPQAEKQVKNEEKSNKNVENGQKTENSPSANFGQYKDIYIEDNTTTTNNNKKGSVKNGQGAKSKKTQVAIPQEMNFDTSLENSETPYKDLMNGDRIALINQWWSIGQNKDLVNRTLLLRRFNSYPISESQMQAVLTSYAMDGLTNYYPHAKSHGDIVRTFPQWALGSKEFYPVVSCEEIKTYISSEETKDTTREKLISNYTDNDGLLNAIQFLQEAIRKFVWRAHERTQNGHLKWISEDFPVPTLKDARYILFNCANFGVLQRFCAALDSYTPQAKEMAKKRVFSDISINILSQVKS